MTATRKEKIRLYFHHPINEYIRPRRWKNIVPFLTYSERTKEVPNTMGAYFLYFSIPLLLLIDSLSKISIPKLVFIISTTFLALDLMRRYRTLYVKGRAAYRPFLGLWNFYFPSTASILNILILFTSTTPFIRGISAVVVLVNIPIFAIYILKATIITEKQEHYRSISSFILFLLSLFIPVAMLFFMTYTLLRQIDALTTLQEILLSSITPSIFLGWLYQNRKTRIEHYLPTHKELFASVPQLIDDIASEEMTGIERFIATTGNNIRATSSPKLINQWDFLAFILRFPHTKDNLPLKRYAIARFLDSSRIYVGHEGFFHFPWQTFRYNSLKGLYEQCGLPPKPPKDITKRYWEMEIVYANNPRPASIPLIINPQNKVLSQKNGILMRYDHSLFEGPRQTLSKHPMLTSTNPITEIESVLQETNSPITAVTYYKVIYENDTIPEEITDRYIWKQLDKTNFPAELFTSLLSLEETSKESRRDKVKSKVLNFLWPQKT